MPTSGVTVAVAVAGGTGAFLGAGIGQLIQWRRDVWHEALVDRRRIEDADRAAAERRRDARRADYVEVLGVLFRLRQGMRSLFIFAGTWATEPDNESWRATTLEKHADLQAILVGAFMDAFGLVETSGSEETRAQFERLMWRTAGFGTSTRVRVGRILDEDVLAAALDNAVKGNTAPVELDEHYIEYDRSNVEIANDVHDTAKSLVGAIDDLRRQLRSELDLHG